MALRSSARALHLHFSYIGRSAGALLHGTPSQLVDKVGIDHNSTRQIDRQPDLATRISSLNQLPSSGLCPLAFMTLRHVGPVGYREDPPTRRLTEALELHIRGPPSVKIPAIIPASSPVQALYILSHVSLWDKYDTECTAKEAWEAPRVWTMILILLTMIRPSEATSGTTWAHTFRQQWQTTAAPMATCLP